MRIKTPLPPLVFSFSSTDNLLDAMSAVKPPVNSYTLYRFRGRYYMLLPSKLSTRIKHRLSLGEYGIYIGSGNIFTAFLEEHNAVKLTPMLK